MYDVIIIGAGVSGCAVARELSRYQGKFCVLEREEDVCCGTSKANSGIVHAGFDAEPGSMKAKMNLEGSRKMKELSEELDIPFEQNGSLVVCTSEEQRGGLEELLERGQKNGVQGLQILEREELMKMEPNLSDQVIAGLYAPTGGIVCPFELTIALAENACSNGVEFRFCTEVQRVEKLEEGFRLTTSGGTMETRTVVNAAGVYADVFHNMVSEEKIHITPRKGEYQLLDKTAGGHVHCTVFALPGKYGKGVLVTPTVHGNLLVGPTAADIEDKEGTNTTREGLDTVAAKSAETVKNVPLRQVITSFAGLRAHEDRDDFVLGQPADAAGFFDCAGIESPGLTSAPAIGRYLAEQAAGYLNLPENTEFHPERKGIQKLSEMDFAQRMELIREEPAYGRIICRCEGISEGEILDAIRRPLGAKSLDGIKRRTRAGMGRCQAGFCSPKVMELLVRECGIGWEQLTKTGKDSWLICGKNKDGIEESTDSGIDAASASEGGKNETACDRNHRRRPCRSGGGYLCGGTRREGSPDPGAGQRTGRNPESVHP